MGGFVRTLTGDIDPSALGRTLIHEHLAVDWGEMLGRPKVLDWDRAAMAVRGAWASGIHAGPMRCCARWR